MKENVYFRTICMIVSLFIFSSYVFAWDNSMEMWHPAEEISSGHFSGGRFSFDDGVAVNDSLWIYSNSDFYNTITVHNASIQIGDDLIVGNVASLTNETYIDGVLITASASELNSLTGVSVLNGGVYFGDGSKITQDVSNFYWDNDNNKLGIGTNLPNSTLDIRGNVTINTSNGEIIIVSGGDNGPDFRILNNENLNLMRIGSSLNGGVEIDSLGNVGIGTTNPQYKLDVSGSQRILGNLVVEGITQLNDLNVSGFTILKDINATNFIFEGNGNVENDFVVDTDTLFIDSVNNRVGIKNLNPNQELDVNGNIEYSGQLISTIETGNQPIVVVSNTKVNNLNSDFLDGYDTSIISSNGVIYISKEDGNLPDNTVSSATVDDESLTSMDLGDSSVGSSEVIDNSLMASDIGADQIGNSELFNGGEWITTSSLIIGADNTGLIISTDGYLSDEDDDLIVDDNLEVLGNEFVQGDLHVNGNTYLNNLNVSGFTVMQELNATSFIFEGNGNIANDLIVDDDTLVVDSTNDRVGINVLNPTDSLQVVGTTKLDGSLMVSDDTVLNGDVVVSGELTFNDLNPNGQVCGPHQVVTRVGPNDWRCSDYIETQDDVTVSVVGFTSSTYTGNLGGYDGANEKCNSEYLGSHICTTQEMLTTINYYDYKTDFVWTGTVWFSGGAPGFTANANDCKGFTSSNSDVLGRFWNLDETSTGGMAWLTSCSQSKRLACCK